MISENLLDTLNDQINYELASEYLYLAMQSYCESVDLKGFANFFIVQIQEERFHAMKFFNFLTDMDQRVLLTPIAGPGNEYTGMLDCFEKSLAHEKTVTGRIYNLSDIAMEEKEHATLSLLKWFIDEQVEEESNFTTIVKKLKRIGDDSAALYLLDTELAARVYVAPTVV